MLDADYSTLSGHEIYMNCVASVENDIDSRAQLASINKLTSGKFKGKRVYRVEFQVSQVDASRIKR
jgi:hypothetical protein